MNIIIIHCASNISPPLESSGAISSPGLDKAKFSPIHFRPNVVNSPLLQKSTNSTVAYLLYQPTSQLSTDCPLGTSDKVALVINCWKTGKALSWTTSATRIRKSFQWFFCLLLQYYQRPGAIALIFVSGNVRQSSTASLQQSSNQSSLLFQLGHWKIFLRRRQGIFPRLMFP